MQLSPDTRAAIVAALRDAGACFAFLHGSRAQDRARADSDIDIAAHWGTRAPATWDVSLPAGVDLLVLDGAPLELAGRVALHGMLLFDNDPPARVRWQADTRRICLDEEERQRRLDDLYLRRRHG